MDLPLLYESISIAEENEISALAIFAYDYIILIDVDEVEREVLDRSETIIVSESVTLDIKVYGVKIISPVDENLFTILTADVSTIFSAGRVTMPNALNVDGTYGTDIALSDLGAVPLADVGVLLFPVEFTYAITNIELLVSVYPQAIAYMDSSENYYEHNKANGQMTAWTAGNLTNGDATTFDYIASMFPVAFWDIMGQTTFTQVRLFAGMCYLIYDSSAGVYKKVYSIGNKGVSKIDYSVFIKHYNPQPKYIEIGLDGIAVNENVSLGVS